MESSLGEQLKKLIESELSKINKTYNNPYEKAVQKEVGILMTELIRSDYKDKIKGKIEEQMSDGVLDKIVSAAWQKLMDY